MRRAIALIALAALLFTGTTLSWAADPCFFSGPAAPAGPHAHHLPSAGHDHGGQHHVPPHQHAGSGPSCNCYGMCQVRGVSLAPPLAPITIRFTFVRQFDSGVPASAPVPHAGFWLPYATAPPAAL